LAAGIATTLRRFHTLRFRSRTFDPDAHHKATPLFGSPSGTPSELSCRAAFPDLAGVVRQSGRRAVKGRGAVCFEDEMAGAAHRFERQREYGMLMRSHRHSH
jgi:hypothetical protein